MQREIQRVVQIVVQVSSGTDHEINQPALHEFHHATAQSSWSQSTGDRQSDGRIVLGQQHLVGENPARFAQPGGIEGLKPLINQLPHISAATRTVVTNRPAGQVAGAIITPDTRSTVGHAASLP